MAKQTFTTGQVLTAAQMTSLQQTAMGGGAATAKTASYVLVAADAGTTVAINAAGATTITVNTGLFAAGDTVFIQNLGAGACTVTAGTATVATAGSLILPQNDAGILYFTSASAAIFYDYIQVGATSPLTTKGDLYTFGTSDTRLGVGANGTKLVADSAEATGLKWQADTVNTVIDAEGDLLVGDAADIVQRLAIGSNAQVLTVDTSVDGKIKWATPGAPATNFTLVGSVSLSGANVFTISGITDANQIMIQFDSLTVQQQSTIYIRINADSGANYRYNGVSLSNTGSWTLSTTGTNAQLTSANNWIQIARTSVSTGSQADGYLFIDGCNSSGAKFYHGVGGARQDGSSTTQYNWNGGYWDNSSTVTSVSILNSTLNMSGGTMRVFKA